MPLPKVLIFGLPFNKNSGGGITLSNLFAGWDQDKIAVACTGHFVEIAEPDICNYYYQLGRKEHQWIYPFNKFQQGYDSGVVRINKVSVKEKKPVKKNWRKSLVDGIFFPFLKYFGVYYRLSSINLSPEFCKWVTEYNPDVIYAQVSERDAILFVQQLSDFLKKPLIIHIMDDWPSIISSKGLFKKYWKTKIDQEFRALLNKASLLLSISDSMAAEYKGRYGKKFVTFHNPINLEFWKKHQKNIYKLNEPPSILYAGRIGIGIEKSLQLIAESVNKVNNELKVSLKFILQTQEEPSWFSNYDCILHRPFVAYNDLPQKFAEADILILPYDFSPEAIKFIKYSMPTKAPEYMVCGAPILVFAPEVTATAKYAMEFGWAKVVTENSSEVLANAIKSLILNIDERKEIAWKAKNLAETNHDAKIVVTRFRDTISSLVNRKLVKS